jgi:predicted DNA-binding transcriptional regulator AlpA
LRADWRASRPGKQDGQSLGNEAATIVHSELVTVHWEAGAGYLALNEIDTSHLRAEVASPSDKRRGGDSPEFPTRSSLGSNVTDIPAYPSRATMAKLLDCAESTVDELVKRGILPKPMRLTPGCVRWKWSAVVAALASIEQGSPAERDPYLVGVKNAAQGD